MEGIVTVSGTTLTMTSDAVGGSGTFAAWTFSIVGNVGSAGAAGTNGTNGTDGTDGTDGTNASTFIFGGTNSTGFSESTTGYLGLGQYGQGTTEADYQVLMPKAGSITNLTVKTGSAETGSITTVLTLRVNGVDKTLTCTVAVNTTTCSDTAHSVAVVAGDLVTLKAVSGNYSGAGAVKSIRVAISFG